MKINLFILGLILLTLIQSCTINNRTINNNNSSFILSSPEQEGFDQELFNEVIDKIEKGDYGTLTSLIVLSKDKLIGEYYFNRWVQDSVHSVQSISKSITSLLIGKAVELNKINSLDEKIIDIFSEYKTENYDLRKESLSIKHYLTMTAGFDWSEKFPAKDMRSSLYPLYRQNKDYIKYVFDQPLAHSPGEVFEYNSGLSMTLGAILQRKTSMEVENFADEYLFKPMNIKYVWHNSVIWKDDENGLAHCGGGLYLRPIDMAKIGSLVFHDGEWKGKRLISKNWIKESTAPIISAQNTKRYRDYGYQWWLYEPLFGLDTIIYADGYAGQNIFIIKEFDLVIVTTGDLASNATASMPLMYDVLTCNIGFRQKFFDFYEKAKSEDFNIDQFKSEELVSVAQNLVFYKEYTKAIDFLTKYIYAFENNWYYEFYLGKAYFYNKDYKLALLYLNKSISNNSGNAWYLKPYCDNAKQMIKEINEYIQKEIQQLH